MEAYASAKRSSRVKISRIRPHAFRLLLGHPGVRRVSGREDRLDLGPGDAGHLTLVIHLTRPAGDLPYLLALPGAAPIPPNPDEPGAPFGVATGHDRYGSFLVSSGPYMLESSENLDFSAPPREQEPVEGFVPGRSVTLVRNPSWDRASDPLRLALPDRIEVSIGGSRREAFQAVESGRADVLFESLAGVDDEIQALRNAGLQDLIHAGDDIATVFISMNLAVPVR